MLYGMLVLAHPVQLNKADLKSSIISFPLFLFFCLNTKEPKSQGLTVLAKSLTEGLSASRALGMV